MRHLNYFYPYNSKSEEDEDVLTRAFMSLSKLVPEVQNIFLDLVRESLLDTPYSKLLPSSSAMEFDLDIAIQTGRVKNDEGCLLSILLTDQACDFTENVTISDRKAVYDAVMGLGDQITLIIENKPNVQDVRRVQLNPSKLSLAGKAVQPVHKPICIEWPVILERINILVEKSLLPISGKLLVDDFLEYIDQSSRFNTLKPYTKFGVCGTNSSLLNSRAVNILAEMGEVKKLSGWKHYIECSGACKMIALSADSHRKPNILLELAPGAGVHTARLLYSNLNLDLLRELNLSSGWNVTPNFHFSDSYRQIFFGNTKLDVIDYLVYWKKHAHRIRQYCRAQTDFRSLCEEFLAEGFISRDDLKDLEQNLFNSDRSKLNVIPGLSVVHTWKLADAVALDSRSMFLSDVKQKINLAFPCWGQDDSNILPSEIVP